MYLVGFLFMFSFSLVGFLCTISKLINFISSNRSLNNTRVQEYKDRLKNMP